MPSLVGRHGVSLLSVAWTLGSRVFRFSDAALSWEYPDLHILSRSANKEDSMNWTH